MTVTEAPVGAAPTVTSNRTGLIAIAAVLATVTNAVAFMLPPLLTVITTSYAHNSVAEATWVFSALTLGGGAGFVLIPRLTDILSDRAISLVSAAFLTGGALVAAVINNYPALVVGCALMGFGSAAQLVPLSFLRRHLSGNAVSTAVSVLIMATGTGVVLGMLGGGLSVKWWPMSTHFLSSHGLPLLDSAYGPLIPHQSLAPFFYILAALFALTTLGLLVIVPNTPAEASTGRIGAFGTLWLIGWVSVILLALTAPSGTALHSNAVVITIVGVVLAIVWAVSQRRSQAPVFDLALLRKPFVTTACISAGLFGCVDAAFLVLVNYYIQNPNAGTQVTPVVPGRVTPGWPANFAPYGLGDDPLKTGIILLPFALTMFLSGKASERIVAKGRPGLVLVVGAAICAVGLLFLANYHDQTWHYVLGSAIVGLGSRAGYSGAFAVPQFVVPQRRAGMAAGMAGTLMAIGFALGAALITVDQNSSGFTYHAFDTTTLTKYGTAAQAVGAWAASEGATPPSVPASAACSSTTPNAAFSAPKGARPAAVQAADLANATGSAYCQAIASMNLANKVEFAARPPAFMTPFATVPTALKASLKVADPAHPTPAETAAKAYQQAVGWTQNYLTLWNAKRTAPTAFLNSAGDALYDGVHTPAASAYTSGYFLALGFPLLVIVMTLGSRFRNKDGFRMLLESEES